VLAVVGVELRVDAYLFSNDPAHSRPWNPDWAADKVAEAADAAWVKLDIRGGRQYTASQFLRRLRRAQYRRPPRSQWGGGTTLRHYADPVPEAGRRGAAYLAKLTAGSAAKSS
jgi:integrase